MGLHSSTTEGCPGASTTSGSPYMSCNLLFFWYSRVGWASTVPLLKAAQGPSTCLNPTMTYLSRIYCSEERDIGDFYIIYLFQRIYFPLLKTNEDRETKGRRLLSDPLSPERTRGRKTHSLKCGFVYVQTGPSNWRNLTVHS